MGLPGTLINSSPQAPRQGEGSHQSCLGISMNRIRTALGRGLEGRGLKNGCQALAGVAQWIERWLVHTKAAGSIPSRGTCLVCRPGLASTLYISLGKIKLPFGLVKNTWAVQPTLSIS